MHLTQDALDEINLLTRYNLNTLQEGIKIHSSAEASVIGAAVKRLHHKGLITQADGGYLTPLGITAAEHAQALLQILK
jgi:uncharacterized protein (TIGR02647 family)